MGLLLTPTPWTRQPQGQVSVRPEPAFVWTPSASLLVPAKGQTFTQTGTIDSAIASSIGQTANFASGAYLTRPNYAPIVSSDGAFGGDFTVFVLTNPATNATVAALLAQREGGSPYSQFAIQANANAAGSAASGFIQFSTYENGYITTDYSGGIDGAYHVFAMRRMGSTLTGWIDGVQVASVTGAVKAIGTATAGFGIGVAPPTYNPTMAQLGFAFASGFNFAVVDMFAMSKNVWQVFAPLPRRMWVAASAGVAFIAAQPKPLSQAVRHAGSW